MQQSSFKKIYEDHSSMVYNLCLNYTGNVHDAEDVTQEVFLRVHKKLDQFRDASQLRTWIYRITVNQCLDFLRSRRRKRGGFLVTMIFGEKDETSVPDFDHPGVKLEDKEAVSEIFRRMNRLPERQKTALLLRAVEGLP